MIFLALFNLNLRYGWDDGLNALLSSCELVETKRRSLGVGCRGFVLEAETLLAVDWTSFDEMRCLDILLLWVMKRRKRNLLLTPLAVSPCLLQRESEPVLEVSKLRDS